MKAACDQERALVGIGILWDEGYTIQKIDENGQPYDQFVKTTREYLKPLDPTVELTIRGQKVELRAWRLTTLAPIHSFCLSLLLPSILS